MWYLTQVPMLENCRLKSQSRQATSSFIKSGILTIERVQGAVKKSTNRIDDILKLTSKGQELVSQINEKTSNDRQC